MNDSNEKELKNSKSTSPQPLEKKENLKEDTDPPQKNNDPPLDKEIKPILEVALEELTKNRNDLQKELEDLTNKKNQIEKELKSSFIGQSDEIAKKLKGFQDYLNGALQDLVQSAEKLELVVQPVVLKPSPLDEVEKASPKQETENIQAISDTFKPDEGLIRDCLEQL